MAMADSFDQFVADAIDVKYQGTPEPFVDMMRIRTWNLCEFVDALVAGGYPPERLEGAVIRAFDLKLQFYYLVEVDLGIYNQAYSAALDANGLTYETATPNLLLTRLSLDQNLIGKMRILWERLMNLVYFVETGKEIPGKSKKGKFFTWIDNDAPHKWSWLGGFSGEIVAYDDRFRTPEFHKNSTLRKEIHERGLDPNELIRPLHNFTNGMWASVVSAVKGEIPMTRPTTTKLG